MPKIELNPNEREFYRRECVDTENHATEQWKKKYGGKMDKFDAVYTHIPSMQRCITGLNTQDALNYVEKGGLEGPKRPETRKIPHLPKWAHINRPLTAHQGVGLGGLGIMSDHIQPPRIADTVYEQDYCITKDTDQQIQQMMNKALDKTWVVSGRGTRAVIPTSWQFPPGVKQPVGFMIRSELRKLRLDNAMQETKTLKDTNNSQISQNPHTCKKQTKGPIERPLPSSEEKKDMGDKKHDKPGEEAAVFIRRFHRESRPWQSRSWAPNDNPAPRGWYKEHLGPGKLYEYPGVQRSPNIKINRFRCDANHTTPPKFTESECSYNRWNIDT